MKKVLLLCVLLFNYLHAAEYAIAFVHIGNDLPPYTLDALKQARVFNQGVDIFLIANKSALSPYQEPLQELKVSAVACEDLKKSKEHLQFKNKAHLGAFWLETSERFYVLSEFMEQYGIEHLFHLENDNMLYVDLSTLWPLFKKHYPGIATTLDADHRGIAGFIYFGSRDSLKQLTRFGIEQAKHGLNDMDLLANFKHKQDPCTIDSLPIIPSEYANTFPLKNALGHEVKNPLVFMNHVDQFSSIFDAAALGQYLGGIHTNPTPGFVNETCIFNPSLLSYQWTKDEAGRKVPYLLIQGRAYRINNLHIHSKQLYKFAS